MKKSILILIVISVAFINTIQLKKNLEKGNELSLSALTTEVLANSECSLSYGSPLYGTNCYVYDVWPGGANYYWQFDTYNCLMTLCQAGGSNCCYNTRMY